LDIELLIFLPLIFAVTIIFNSLRVRNLASYIYVFVLILISISIFFSDTNIKGSFPHIYHNIFIGLDFLVLLYFISQGIKYKNKLVLILALIQLILFGIVISLEPSQVSNDIFVDRVSSFMLLVVNIVGGIIIIYALKYIESEDMKQCKKNGFISLLFFFVGVMNLIVTTNNLEIFFLAFELTTLCSYLLIRFRFDELAVNNALRALWMNQIGGVAILISLIIAIKYYDTFAIDILLSVANDMFLLPVTLLAIAAFVKGASIPFEKWLLGAMVAPTPVSAILHSATMVKIAPYLILKIAPAFSPVLASLVVLFGSFVFFSASLLALSKDFFKEILGLSTIALLGLMMAIAAIGTSEAINICLILIVFHAISKALLFLQAGILEKVYHLKYLGDINHLFGKSELVVFFIVIGFASLTLPPFGAFIGKLTAIELIASQIQNNLFYLFSLVFILIGSVFLTLLYFKVITKLMTVKKDDKDSSLEIPLNFKVTSFSLVALTFYGIYVSYQYQFLGFVELMIPIVILLGTFVMLFLTKLKSAHLVKEYNCGEKDELSLGAYYFNISKKYQDVIMQTSIALIVIILLVGF
jgi:ech hydrogenase subunit A